MKTNLKPFTGTWFIAEMEEWDHASKKQFQEELKKFMAGQIRRKALIQRLVKLGIWN